MGNVPTSNFEQKDEDRFWINDVRSLYKLDAESGVKSESSRSRDRNSAVASAKLNFNEAVPNELSEENKKKLNEFKLELARKHEKRRGIIEDKRKEMEDLREEIEKLKRENEDLKSKNGLQPDQNEEILRLRKENEELNNLLKEKYSIIEESEIVVRKNHELRISIADMQNDLQRLNTEVVNFELERQDYKRHVVALKDVIAVSKNMLQIRESQLKELKEKVDTIEKSLADKEMTVMSDDLKREYERQMANMRHLRVLYEDRQRAERREKEELASQLDDAKKDLEEQKKKNSELEERISQLELDNSKKYDDIKTLESTLGLTKAENRQYQEELTVINQLFSETLLRYNTTQEFDLDKLQKQLEDHHGLLKDIVVNEVSSEVSYALPKVLLELINQLHDVRDDAIGNVDEQMVAVEDVQEESTNTSARHQMNSAEEIVENLPKVWRVLIELLSHQVVPTNVLTDTEDENSNENPCYKKVETAKGPSLVLSVSQTFIRLKDLILEKKSLEKETSHLKHLNGHLENRLQDQEKRLELVQNELSKTWLVVGKLQKQHQMLHTQEKILRYELAQKRKLLNELKEELEDSREKWTQAREKNSNTEEQWKLLRTEFANRRNTTTVDDLNNSAESGYSDEREGSSDDEPGYETDVSECDKKNSEEVSKDLVISGEEKSSDHSTETSSSSLTNQNDIEIDTPQSFSGNERLSVLHEVSEESSNIEEVSTSKLVEIVSPSASSGPKEDLDTSNEGISVEPTYSEEATTSKVSKEQIYSEEQTISRVTEDPIYSQEPSTSRVTEEPVYSHEPTASRIAEIQSNSTTSQVVDIRPNLEEIFARRDERLKRLEGQATNLVTQATNTANRSVEISNKLDDLHEIYGDSTENVEEDDATEDQEDASNAEQ